VDGGSLNVAIAFAAGALSFLSPCVLPLVPAYLTYITGLSVEEVGDARPSEVLPSALAFVLGLSLVLSLFGLGVTAIGQALSDFQTLLTRVGGAIVIVLGLHTAGLLRIPLLYRQSRVDFTRFRGRGATGALLMGAAFGIGWTPCVGAILGAILTLASQSDTLGRGTLLLLAYSLGLGVPFILVALGIKRAFGLLGAVRRRLRTVELASGALLVATGVLLFTDRLLLLTGWFTQMFGNGLAL
jgi:cytochrome c-type biogenesis protein